MFFVMLPAGPVMLFVILAPPALPILLCAFAILTIYSAADAIAVSRIVQLRMLFVYALIQVEQKNICRFSI
jgi:hypothetical protein